MHCCDVLRGSVHSGNHRAMDRISLAPFGEQTKSLRNFSSCLDAVKKYFEYLNVENVQKPG